MQSSRQIITNKPTSSLSTDRMPFLSPSQQCQSTEGKNITFHGLAYPELTWGLRPLSLTTNSSWLPLSILMAIFPGEPGLASFIEAKDDGSGGDNWTTGAISGAKLQSNHHQTFYRPDALPDAQPC